MMTEPDLPSCREIRANAGDAATQDCCTLSYDERFLRRKVLTTDGGRRILVDLERAISLNHGDALLLDDGRLIGIRAAAEELLEITGAGLLRLAWHIGNRHAPCQIGDRRLLIMRDHVLQKMLNDLGAGVREVVEPFTPEGGAYGHGRTMGHDHGHIHHHAGHGDAEDDNDLPEDPQ